MVTLAIDDATFALWKERAAARGLSVEEWLKAETIRREATIQPSPDRDPEYDPDMPQDEWVARLDAIAKRHPPTGRPLDDSRESIYD
ncbi:MAG TPA: hypothetical protein VF170_07660 [Planctomycetaceae bacterium]